MSAVYLFILDMTGALVIILIINGYNNEDYYEGENKRLSSELSFLREQNIRLKTLNKTKDKFYKAKYNPQITLSTLDVLLDLCRNDTYKARELIQSYKKYIVTVYKYGGNVLKLGKGIEILNAYVKMMQIMYNEKIKINLLIKGEISGCFMPILIIEPIIENSIIHGLIPKSTGGIVFVNIEVTNDK
jgi:LytS/YehU family sensor histidine kinase